MGAILSENAVEAPFFAGQPVRDVEAGGSNPLTPTRHLKVAAASPIGKLNARSCGSRANDEGALGLLFSFLPSSYFLNLFFLEFAN
jgi:hypothetical protein